MTAHSLRGYDRSLADTVPNPWEAGRAARVATLESWMAFGKTGAARGFGMTQADRDALRPVEGR